MVAKTGHHGRAARRPQRDARGAACTVWQRQHGGGGACGKGRQQAGCWGVGAPPPGQAQGLARGHGNGVVPQLRSRGGEGKGHRQQRKAGPGSKEIIAVLCCLRPVVRPSQGSWGPTGSDNQPRQQGNAYSLSFAQAKELFLGPDWAD
jgi:hypothetical protein